MLLTNLLVFGFVFKLLSRKPIFAYINEKHGNETLRLCRGLEKDIIRYEKTSYDLRFLLQCKKESLVPIFAKPKLSIPGDEKLRKQIASLIIKTELKNKHRVRNALKREISEKSRQIQERTSFLLFNALRYKIRMIIASRRKKWLKTHTRKLERLQENNTPQPQRTNDRQQRPNVIHNFSTYELSEREIKVMSYSLDHYVPGKEYGKRTQVEFERFFQEILNNTSHLPERDRVELKTSFLDTFSKYTKVSIPQEDRRIIENLYKNPDLTILRQDKGRGVVILNRVDYITKAETFLAGPEFEKLDSDPTSSFQGRVQRTLLSMKKKFSAQQYKKLYPSSSRPGLYFGLAKVHKLKDNSRSVNELPLRPVISNIGTATYEVSKYLADLLQPLTKSEYTIESTNDFVGKIRDKNIPPDHEMISFDVVSLFTSVPLDFTIELILDKVYKDKLIRTKLSRSQMKNLLEICTMEMHFSFNGVIYRQIDGVAMGSPLGPVLANIFMVELEKTLVPQLQDQVLLWYRYVDDTFTFIKKNCVDEVLHVLNSFHASIKFTFEKEGDSVLSFLDVKVIKKSDGTFDTDIHRKQTDTNIYLNWCSFAPKTWKIGTLKGLIRRALTICSTEEFQNKEISFLRGVFVTRNGFPSKVVSKTIQDVKKKVAEESRPVSTPPQEEDTPVPQEQGAEQVVTPFICLPYKGKAGEDILSKFRDKLTSLLPTNVQPRFTFKGKKLGSYFRVKDPVPLEHQSDCVYACPSEGNPDYVGETKVRYGTRTHEHCFTDKKSAVFKAKQANQIVVSPEDFKIIDRGYTRTLDRKLAEALYIKDLKPPLNEQVKSYKLCLFN